MSIRTRPSRRSPLLVIRRSRRRSGPSRAGEGRVIAAILIFLAFCERLEASAKEPISTADGESQRHHPARPRLPAVFRDQRHEFLVRIGRRGRVGEALERRLSKSSCQKTPLDRWFSVFTRLLRSLGRPADKQGNPVIIPHRRGPAMPAGGNVSPAKIHSCGGVAWRTRVHLSFLNSLAQRVLVFDGAMGTSYPFARAAAQRLQGLENCSEVLNLTRVRTRSSDPPWFLAVGCDVVETNTFGGQEARAGRVRAGGRRRTRSTSPRPRSRGAAAGECSTPSRPRFVAGSMGPGTKLVTLRQISYDELFDSYSRAGLRPARRRRRRDHRSRPARTSCRASASSTPSAWHREDRPAHAADGRRSRWRRPARCWSAPRSPRRWPRSRRIPRWTSSA